MCLWLNADTAGGMVAGGVRACVNGTRVMEHAAS